MTGGYVYRGRAVSGAVGRYFFGDYCSGIVWSLRMQNGTATDVRREPFEVGQPDLVGRGRRRRAVLRDRQRTDLQARRLTRYVLRVLPQLESDLFLTDGGMETWLVYSQGFELPQFAAFPLLDDPRGVEALRAYFAPYVELARTNGVGLVLDAPTWRASSHWGNLLGYDADALADVNRRAVALLEEIRARGGLTCASSSAAASGRATTPTLRASRSARTEAYAYHRPQIDTFAETAADFVNALTLTYAAEAIGIARAAKRRGSAGGDLVHGRDRRTTPERTAAGRGDRGGRRSDRRARSRTSWSTARIRRTSRTSSAGTARGANAIAGVRANASRKSHAELDESEELDAGDPEELGEPLSGAARAPAEPARCRRLLRHRRPPHRGDLRRAEYDSGVNLTFWCLTERVC